MKIWRGILAVIVGSLLLIPNPALAVTARTGDHAVTIRSDETITDDVYAASNDVTVSGTVDGSVIVAGSNVTIDGSVTKDVWAAGSHVMVNGTVGGSIHAAGSDVTIGGKVGGDVIAAGSTVTIRHDATVARDAWAAGGTTTIDGIIGRNLVLGATNATLNGTVTGNVDARTGRSFILASGSSIGGNLTYRSSNEVNRDPEAKVAGTTNYVHTDNRPHKADYLARLFGQIYWFLASLLLLIGILLYARRAAVRAAELIVARPGWSLLAGLLFLIGTPIAFVFLLVTIVGIPLALFTIFGYILVLYTAKLFVALFIGGKILRSKTATFWPALAAGALGLVVYFVLTAIPVVGWIFSLAALLFGIGAQILLVTEVYRHVRSKYGV